MCVCLYVCMSVCVCVCMSVCVYVCVVVSVSSSHRKELETTMCFLGVRAVFPLTKMYKFNNPRDAKGNKQNWIHL